MNDKIITLPNGSTISERDLVIQNKATLDNETKNKATMQDYFQANNPITVGVFHPELKDKFSDVWSESPVDLENKDVKEALNGLSISEQENIVRGSYNNNLIISQAKRAKEQLKSSEKVNLDGGFEQLYKGFIPTMLTPTSIATLPVGVAKVGLGVISSGVKVLGTTAGIGAVNMAGDALVSDIYGSNRDIAHEALVGGAFGAALGVPFMGFAMRNARIAQIADKSLRDAENMASMKVKVDEFGNPVLEADGVTPVMEKDTEYSSFKKEEKASIFKEAFDEFLKPKEKVSTPFDDILKSSVKDTVDILDTTKIDTPIDTIINPTKEAFKASFKEALDNFDASPEGIQIKNLIAEEDAVHNLKKNTTQSDIYIASEDEFGKPTINFAEETIETKTVKEYPKDSPEYKEAYDAHYKDYYESKLAFASKTDEIKMLGKDVKDGIKSKIAQIDKHLKERLETFNFEYVNKSINTVVEVAKKVKVKEPFERFFTDTELSRRAKVSSKAERDALDAKHLKDIDKNKALIAKKKSELKDIGPVKVKEDTTIQASRAKLLKEIEDIETKISNKKTLHKDIIAEIIQKHVGINPKSELTKTTTIMEQRQLTSEELKALQDKAKKEAKKEVATNMKAQKKTLEEELKNVRKTLSAQRAEMLANHYKTAPIKPKIEEMKVPTYVETTQEKTGRYKTDGQLDVPQLEKLLKDPNKASIFYELTSKITNTVNMVDNFFGSKVNVGAQSSNPIVRAYMYALALPTYLPKMVDGKRVTRFKKTADEVKHEYKVFLNNVHKDHVANFYKAKKDGYVNDYVTYNLEVTKHYNKYVQKNTDEAYILADEAYSNDPSKAFDKHLLDAYSELGIKGKETKLNGPEWLKKGVDIYKKYYDEMANTGFGLKFSGFKHLQAGKIYRPTVYDRKAINEMPISTLKDIIKAGIERHPANGTLTNSEIETFVNQQVDSFKNISFREGMDITSFINSDTFGGNALQKKLFMDFEAIDPIIINDMEKITAAYHYKLSGKFALQHAFGEAKVEKVLENLVRESNEKGYTVTNEEKRALQEVLEDILGTLRLASVADSSVLWQFSRSMQAYNVARLLGMSGVVQLTELAGNTFGLASQGILTGKQFGSQLQALKKGFHNPDGSLNSEYLDFIFSCGYLDNTLMINRANRFGDMENGIALGTFERIMSYGASAISRVSGMMGVLNFQETMMGGATINVIKRYGTNKSFATDKELISRWGLSHEDAISLRDDLLKNTDDKLERFAMSDMHPTNTKNLQLAIQRNIKDNVIQGDSIHNPSFLKTAGPVGKLIFQFLRFPLTAQTILLRRGVQTDKAAVSASISGAILSYMSLQWLIEEAKIASGLIDKRDRKYDIFNDPEQAKNAAFKATGYVASLGLLSVGYDHLASVTPLPKAGSTYESRGDGIIGVLGPSISMFNDVQRIAYKKANGETLSKHDTNVMHSWIVGMSIPGIKEAMYAAEEHYK